MVKQKKRHFIDVFQGFEGLILWEGGHFPGMFVIFFKYTPRYPPYFLHIYFKITPVYQAQKKHKIQKKADIIGTT